MSKIINITPELKAAIVEICDEHSQSWLAGISGVNQSNIGKYISGKIKRMNEDTLSRLLPVLESYLPKDAKIKLRDNHGSIIQGIALNLSSSQIGEIEVALLDLMKNMPTASKAKVLTYAEELSRQK